MPQGCGLPSGYGNPPRTWTRSCDGEGKREGGNGNGVSIAVVKKQSQDHSPVSADVPTGPYPLPSLLPTASTTPFFLYQAADGAYNDEGRLESTATEGALQVSGRLRQRGDSCGNVRGRLTPLLPRCRYKLTWPRQRSWIWPRRRLDGILPTSPSACDGRHNLGSAAMTPQVEVSRRLGGERPAEASWAAIVERGDSWDADEALSWGRMEVMVGVR